MVQSFILAGTAWLGLPCGEPWYVFTGVPGIQVFYFEKIRVFKAGIMLEYISME